MYTYFLYKVCLSGLFIYWKIKTILRKRRFSVHFKKLNCFSFLNWENSTTVFLIQWDVEKALKNNPGGGGEENRGKINLKHTPPSLHFL